jgi:acyl carrier protein
MDTRERILAILRRFSSQATLPDPDESLFDSGFLDSFALQDMIVEIEREFSIQVPASDLNPRKFETIARIQTYIESRM